MSTWTLENDGSIVFIHPTIDGLFAVAAYVQLTMAIWAQVSKAFVARIKFETNVYDCSFENS
jgi:hypothetical protein